MNRQNNINKGTILLVEDEADLVKLLSYNFKKDGYRVLASRTAEAGLESVKSNRPDLVVLDIMLPKMDGIEMSRLLRRDSQVPILFLTAKKSELDRVLGLKIGGDDYVTKPFSVKELMARVEAILRRSRPAVPSDGVKRVGAIDLDTERHAVKVNGKALELTPKEFELLVLLYEAAGKVLSREDLLNKVWGHEKGLDLSTRTVDQHVARLRHKLGPERARVVTITNFGYKLRRD